ncbi:MAG: septum site-determining protein MinC, partial [Rhodoferax sp.]|nr:septum site-determining protein MinC [Rhodoferax sp.]
MSVKPTGTSPPPGTLRFEIKSAQLPLVALMVKSDDWDALAADVCQQYGAAGESPDFFDNDPVVLDFSAQARDAALGDTAALLQALRSCRLLPLAFRGEPAGWTAALLDAGLAQA